MATLNCAWICFLVGLKCLPSQTLSLTLTYRIRVAGSELGIKVFPIMPPIFPPPPVRVCPSRPVRAWDINPLVAYSRRRAAGGMEVWIRTLKTNYELRFDKVVPSLFSNVLFFWHVQVEDFVYRQWAPRRAKKKKTRWCSICDVPELLIMHRENRFSRGRLVHESQ